MRPTFSWPSNMTLHQHPQDLLIMMLNNERATGQKQQLFYGRTMENKGKLILTEIFPLVQKYDI